jgi:hypothetical protein
MAAGWSNTPWLTSELPALPNEGLVFISTPGANGMQAKLPTTVTNGSTIDLVYVDSGNVGGVYFILSSQAACPITIANRPGAADLVKFPAQIIFDRPGQSLSFAGVDATAMTIATWCCISYASGTGGPQLVLR